MSQREVDDITQKHFNSKCDDTEILRAGFLIDICDRVPPGLKPLGDFRARVGAGLRDNWY
ncbi:hypothetical protein QUA54_12660 [Microcoleus sp. MOSTC5]